MCYKHLDRLLEKAADSFIYIKMAACIIKNGKMIGEPRCNTHMHAEHSVIRHVLNKKIINNKIKNNNSINYDLFVVRMVNGGETSNARPCKNCWCLMKSVGIRKVYYTVDNYKIICENVQNMVSIHLSSVAKTIEIINHDIKERELYYEYLIKKHFPPTIRTNNLECFIKYNLSNVLPHYKVLITSDYVVIFNRNNKMVIKSKVII